ncbi:hypothetical protein GN244_ATG18696 [Phytophthora infestans]|uniref:Uncharacterized protein n=1 Tax=Phytophthora infestans TaxID=4787 RepID=A0A833W5R1_PHYIN|nr:hypothetical protein GN244_ATG18696 [Phytophthora infestans]KAF4138953.1 hypothetical protein GN958_ATG11910 [Phytophthora infestans]
MRILDESTIGILDTFGYRNLQESLHGRHVVQHTVIYVHIDHNTIAPSSTFYLITPNDRSVVALHNETFEAYRTGDAASFTDVQEAEALFSHKYVLKIPMNAPDAACYHHKVGRKRWSWAS